MLQSRFLLVSREVRRITITEPMARTPGTSSRIDLLLKSMLHLEVDLPWDTFLEVAATNSFGSSNSTIIIVLCVGSHSKWGTTYMFIFSSSDIVHCNIELACALLFRRMVSPSDDVSRRRCR